MSQQVSKSFFAKIDGYVLLMYLALVAIGLCAIYSVEHRSADTAFFMPNRNYTKQLMWLGYSLLAGTFILLTDSRFFVSTAFLGYAVGILLLLITIFAGTDVKGSKSWLIVGGIGLQPGEMCKIFTSLALAKYLSLSDVNFNFWRYRLQGLAISLLPAVLVLAQNETGLALVYFCYILVMYREGLPGSILVAGMSLIALVISTLLVDKIILLIIITVLCVATGVIFRTIFQRKLYAGVILVGVWLFSVLFSQFAVPFAFKHVLKPHHIDRIYSMLGKEVPENYKRANPDDEEGDSKKDNASEYNVLQSKIAIGSGGMLGKGFLNGTSTKNQFVPEQHTDFIFCAVGEQFGFVGSFVLIGLYIGLMLRIVYKAEKQKSVFSRVYAYAVAAILFFHFAINISMTIGLAPVIGITLPLLSYGGTSLMSFSVLLFIFLRLDIDRHASIR
ncbi:MAG: rod shape-determining protein RodA [Chitinophagia bacterium]|nr:rod shape-determining protein RodA [Chitinophagia bacterium]